MAVEMTGSGTAIDPYVIYDVTDLQDINDPAYGYGGDGESIYYELANDIDASDTINWFSGLGFMPLGEDEGVNGFNFDGKGFAITGLYMCRECADTSGLGFVGYGWNWGLTSNNIKNVDFIDCVIKQKEDDLDGIYGLGIIAGVIWDVNAENINIVNGCCQSNGIGGGYLGGAWGYISPEKVHDVYFQGTIAELATGDNGDLCGSWAGLIDWATEDAEVWRCKSIADVSLMGITEMSQFGGFAFSIGSYGDIGEVYPNVHDCFTRGALHWRVGISAYNMSAFSYRFRGGDVKHCYAAFDLQTYNPYPTLVVTTVEMGVIEIKQGYLHTQSYPPYMDGFYPDDFLCDEYYSPVYTSWSASRDDTTGYRPATEGDAVHWLKAGKYVQYSPDRFQISRSFMYFDTSQLYGLTITAAKLRLEVEDWYEADAGYSTIHITEGVQHLPLVETDYGDQKDYVASGGSLARQGYDWHNEYHLIDIDLNSTGIGWINQATSTHSITKLCLRLAADVNNTTPTGVNDVKISSNFEWWSPFTDEYDCENCFFDRNLSGWISQPDWNEEIYPPRKYPKTTAEMKTESTFTSKGWDFDETWFISEGINDGYPDFKPFFDTGDFYWW